MLVAFAAEPGPRKWSWICLAASEFGDSSSFLSFHNGPVTLAEFRGPDFPVYIAPLHNPGPDFPTAGDH